MQAHLIFAAKEVPKKHNIPFAIIYRYTYTAALAATVTEAHSPSTPGHTNAACQHQTHLIWHIHR
jgi:hypothetical protein